LSLPMATAHQQRDPHRESSSRRAGKEAAACDRKSARSSCTLRENEQDALCEAKDAKM
jgi:hypothetical protein